VSHWSHISSSSSNLLQGGTTTSFTTTPTTEATPLDTGTLTSISVQASAAGASGLGAAAATMPGKKLSVLPIGLGVFAGISVIALIIVGLVTYERTKYRKVCLSARSIFYV
jgi:hypothetical protein